MKKYLLFVFTFSFLIACAKQEAKPISLYKDPSEKVYGGWFHIKTLEIKIDG